MVLLVLFDNLIYLSLLEFNLIFFFFFKYIYDTCKDWYYNQHYRSSNDSIIYLRSTLLNVVI